MMKTIRAYVLILVVFALLVASCTLGTTPDEGDLGELIDSRVVEEPLAGLEPGSPKVGRYEFIMTTDYKDGKIPFPDTFKTGWEGLFTIDSNGKIKGDGTFHFISEVYLMVEFPEPCGYQWNENGAYEYDIGGNVIPGKAGIPIKIHSYTLLEGSEMIGPVQICASNIDKIINEPRYQTWGESRRGSMFGAIIAPIDMGSSIIPEAGVPFEITFQDELLGTITYTINITYLGP